MLTPNCYLLPVTRTRVVLGLRAKEIHVCGGLEAAGIVESLAKSCGDDFELVKYDRLSELK
jgi:ATP-dependent RNA helicase SUPV3L1/SUV3